MCAVIMRRQAQLEWHCGRDIMLPYYKEGTRYPVQFRKCYSVITDKLSLKKKTLNIHLSWQADDKNKTVFKCQMLSSTEVSIATDKISLCNY